MSSADLENKIERLINFLEDFRQSHESIDASQEANYLIKKKDAAIANQKNVTISPFEISNNSLNESEDNSILNSSEIKSTVLKKSRRNAIDIDLKKKIDVNGKEMELGNLLDILDFYVTKKNESENKNDFSNSNNEKNTNNQNSENKNSENQNTEKKNNQNNPNQKNCSLGDDPLRLKINQGACRIELMLKGLLHKQRLIRQQNENKNKKNEKTCYRRKSMFDFSNVQIPINKNNEQRKVILPSYEESFFGELEKKKQKKRHTVEYVKIKNNLQFINQQNKKNSEIDSFCSDKNSQSMSKINSSIKKENISGFDLSCENKPQSEIKNFESKMSEVKKKRQSEFFDVKDINNFNGMINEIDENDEKFIGEKINEKNQEFRGSNETTKLEEEEDDGYVYNISTSLNFGGLEI